MRKLVCITLAALLVALSAGCSGGSTPPQSSASSTAAQSVAPASSSVPEAPAAPSELKMMVNDWFLDRPFLMKGVENFEAETNVKVVLNPIDWTTGSAQHAIAFAAGNPPDVIQLSDWSVRTDILSGRLNPLNEFITDDEIAKCNQGFVERFSHDGKLYAYMANTDVRMMLYNKAIFEEAGLDRDAFPETWSEFMATMEKVNHVRGSSQYAYGFIGTTAGVHTTIMWETLVRSLGGKAIDPDTGKVLFGSPETVKAAEFYKEIVDKGYASKGVLGYDEAAMVSEFISGNLAVMMVGSWTRNRDLKDSGFNMDDLGYAYIPRADDGIFATIGGAWSLCMSSATKYPDMSWKLIETVYSDEYFIDNIVVAGQVPTREKYMSAVENDPYAKWITDYSLTYGQAELHSQYFIEDVEALNIALNAAISGSADIQSTFDQVAKDLNTKHGL